MTATTLFQASVSLPADPAQVPPEATLAELREIKAGWVAMAEQLSYLSEFWTVLNYLGSPAFVQGHPGTKLWRSQDGELAIIGREYERKFDDDHSAWLVERRLTVWLRNSTEMARNAQMLRNAGPVDAVIFSSHCVARQTWTYLDVHSPTLMPTEAEALFLPGQWIAKVLMVMPDARAQLRRTVVDAGEAERRDLLATLLVGQQI